MDAGSRCLIGRPSKFAGCLYCAVIRIIARIHFYCHNLLDARAAETVEQRYSSTQQASKVIRKYLNHHWRNVCNCRNAGIKYS